MGTMDMDLDILVGDYNICGELEFHLVRHQNSLLAVVFPKATEQRAATAAPSARG